MSGSRSGRDPNDIGGAGDRYEALVEVLRHEARRAAREREQETESRRRRRRIPKRVVAVLFVIAAWVWLAPPSILRTPAPPPRPMAEEAATLRFLVYVQAERVAAFRAREGRLPEALDEAGPPLPGMDYVKLTDRLYQLTGSTDRIALTYRSDLPLAEFVGGGAAILGGTGGG